MAPARDNAIYPLRRHDFAPGDLVAFSGRGFTSRFIKAVTCPPWYWFRAHWRAVSHIGICAQFSGRLFLVEATTLCDLPCELTGRAIEGVQAHDPWRRIEHYPGFVYRARSPKMWRLNEEGSHELSQFLADFIGKEYDTWGAIQAGAGTARDADLSQLFCSEAVAAVLIRLGRLPLSDPSSYTPASVLRSVVRIGSYDPPERVR